MVGDFRMLVPKVLYQDSTACSLSPLTGKNFAADSADRLEFDPGVVGGKVLFQLVGSSEAFATDGAL